MYAFVGRCGVEGLHAFRGAEHVLDRVEKHLLALCGKIVSAVRGRPAHSEVHPPTAGCLRGAGIEFLPGFPLHDPGGAVVRPFSEQLAVADVGHKAYGAWLALDDGDAIVRTELHIVKDRVEQIHGLQIGQAVEDISAVEPSPVRASGDVHRLQDKRRCEAVPLGRLGAVVVIAAHDVATYYDQVGGIKSGYFRVI